MCWWHLKDNPLYQHDCSQCRFLGNFHTDAPLADNTTVPMDFDLYVCPSTRPLGASLIARHGNEGSEYASTTEDILPNLIAHVKERGGQHSTYSAALIEAYNRSK